MVLISIDKLGTPASIAAKQTTLLKEGEAADIVWLYNSTVNLLSSRISSTALPVHWPGTQRIL